MRRLRIEAVFWEVLLAAKCDQAVVYLLDDTLHMDHCGWPLILEVWVKPKRAATIPAFNVSLPDFDCQVVHCKRHTLQRAETRVSCYLQDGCEMEAPSD